MKLTLLSKLARQICKSIPANTSTAPLVSGEQPTPDEKHSAVILKEKKRSVQIACWGCGKRFWAMKGSRCHKEGLCHPCLQNRGRR